MNLFDLPLGQQGVVQAVRERAANDGIARRLRELGFVCGEPVQLLARGPFGGDPLLIRVGEARFALRRVEAERVQLQSAG